MSPEMRQRWEQISVSVRHVEPRRWVQIRRLASPRVSRPQPAWIRRPVNRGPDPFNHRDRGLVVSKPSSIRRDPKPPLALEGTRAVSDGNLDQLPLANMHTCKRSHTRHSRATHDKAMRALRRPALKGGARFMITIRNQSRKSVLKSQR